jgi:hypothetical protein
MLDGADNQAVLQRLERVEQWVCEAGEVCLSPLPRLTSRRQSRSFFARFRHLKRPTQQSSSPLWKFLPRRLPRACRIRCVTGLTHPISGALNVCPPAGQADVAFLVATHHFRLGASNAREWYDNLIMSATTRSNHFIDDILWIGQNSHMEYLLPFMILHHDQSANPIWPGLPEEAMIALPALVEMHAAYVSF